METPIINKVSLSALITIDLEEYYTEGERAIIDIKEYLFRGLILRELDFREFIRTHDWQQYQNKLVAVWCSTDSVIPTWAYMLVASKLEPFVRRIIYGSLENLENVLYLEALTRIHIEDYRDKRIVVKGCGHKPVPAGAYLELTRMLTPVVKSIMYGEPCSTVPVFKR
jgi:hypothetical protein